MPVAVVRVMLMLTTLVTLGTGLVLLVTRSLMLLRTITGFDEVVGDADLLPVVEGDIAARGDIREDALTSSVDRVAQTR